MKRAAILLAVLLASPAWAADQWNAGTLTGTGRTEALSYPATCSSSIALAIPRRATSLSSALTKYVVTGVGTITATAYTPTSRTNFTTIQAVGCDGTNVFVGGGATWMEYIAIASLGGAWTSIFDTSATNNSPGGAIYASPAGGGKYRYSFVSTTGNQVQLTDVTTAASFTGVAANASAASEKEIVSAQVSSSFDFIAAQNSSDGRPYFRGYVSGGSFTFTSQAGSTMQASGEFFYPAFGLNGTLGVATQYSTFYSSTTRAAFVTSAGSITILSVGAFDAIPLGDWDPTGSLRRGWFIRKSSGAAYSTDSASAPTAISAASTYDIPSDAMGGSTPLFAIMGLDMEGDGGTNPVVMMADGSHFAWWGSVATNTYRTPKRKASGPFNSYPFTSPGASQ